MSNEDYITYEVGNITFIVEPICKEQGRTIEEMLKALLKREAEDLAA